MAKHSRNVTRRDALGTIGKFAAFSVGAAPLSGEVRDGISVTAEPLAADAGIDRVVMLHGKTYLNGWAGYGTRPRAGRGGGRGAAAQVDTVTGPAPTMSWSKRTGPGDVAFADPQSP